MLSGKQSNALAYLNTKLPAIPPIPPRPTIIALPKARFHCPRILVAWYARHAGTLEFAPAISRNVPRYRIFGFGCQPRIGKPMLEHIRG